MGELKKTDPLTVRRGSPKYELLTVNPNETISIDFLTTTEEFHLFLDINDFIKDNDNFVLVTITQENNCDRGCLYLHNKLYQDLKAPTQVVICRKNNNIFLKPN